MPLVKDTSAPSLLPRPLEEEMFSTRLIVALPGFRIKEGSSHGEVLPGYDKARSHA